MKRALLVIEVQNEHIGGAEKITYPSLHVSMPNIAMAMDLAAQHGIFTVEVVRVGAPDATTFAKGSAGSGLHPLIADNPYDLRVVEPTPGAFGSDELASKLTASKITTVTLVGYAADEAITSTAQRARAAGFEVEILADATGCRVGPDSSVDDRALFERTMAALSETSGCTVSATSAWDDAISRGVPLTAGRLHENHEDERPTKLRVEFYKIESWARAEAENIDADADAQQIQRTFALGAQPL